MTGLDNLHLQNLRVSVDRDGIATVTLDTPGKSVNSLTRAMFADLAAVVDELERQAPAGVIFTSGKAKSFIAGADLFELREMNAEQIETFLANGQALFERIARLPVATAAAINGDCLGGGLELALACNTRVAVADGSISIGLPEVKLGLVPGWGGTVRLPRLIGLPTALPLLLAGKTMPPKKALDAGIVDAIAERDELLDAAKRLLVQNPSRSELTSVPDHIFDDARRRTAASTRGNYPAPLRLIEVVQTGFEKGPAAGFDAERTALRGLMETDACRNLLRLFFLRQGAKRTIFDQLREKPAEMNQAAVIGGGTMGAGIVHALARAGVSVQLIEVNARAMAGAIARVQKMLDDELAAGRISLAQSSEVLNRIAASCEWTELSHADIVIEAVVEQREAKREVFSRLDQLTRPDAILASNTSSLSIADLAAATTHPARVIGLHFFNPVPKMPLVEVVRGPQSDPRALATAAGLALRLGKTPLLVRDAPGFLVNRVLIPYLDEALRAAGEGVAIQAIDRALKDWGMPMGPFELLDEIGLDIAMHILQSFGEHFPERAAVPALLKQAVADGWLGKKTSKGFYLHGPGRRRDAELAVNEELTALIPSSPAASATSDEIQWRLILPMLNEAARLLSEGVADSTDAVDLGTVLGLGLAPFRGGLAHFADTVGIESIVRRTKSFAIQHGQRFAPAPVLIRLAELHRPLSGMRENASANGHE